MKQAHGNNNHNNNCCFRAIDASLPAASAPERAVRISRLCHITSYYVTLHYVMLHVTLSYIILYGIILCYVILYCIILYYMILSYYIPRLSGSARAGRRPRARLAQNTIKCHSDIVKADQEILKFTLNRLRLTKNR